jgi:hypothetical protein
MFAVRIIYRSPSLLFCVTWIQTTYGKSESGFPTNHMLDTQPRARVAVPICQPCMQPEFVPIVITLAVMKIRRYTNSVSYARIISSAIQDKYFNSLFLNFPLN